MNDRSTAFPDPEDDPGSSPSASARPKRSRLDREVDEILSKTAKTQPPPPISFAERVSRRSSPRPKAPDPRRWLHETSRWLTAVPLLTALGIAILCAMVGDSSPLLARLLAIGAVAMLLYPIYRRFRTGSSPSSSKMWRGQVMDLRASQSTPIDQIKRWFRSRPPR